MRVLASSRRLALSVPVFLIVVIFILASATVAEAQTSRRNPRAFESGYRISTPLDKPYRNLQHPIQVPRSGMRGPPASDTVRVIGLQTEVKAQGSRGTCSIFSAIALLEAMLIRSQGLPRTIDLSEQWLQYLMMYGRVEDGSNSMSNFNMLARMGTTSEQIWPYGADDWTKFPGTMGMQRCGRLVERVRKASCLLGQRDPELIRASKEQLNNSQHELFDPEFAKIRDEAAQFRDRHLTGRIGQATTARTTNDIKETLRLGVPLALDIDFYYGAWNHRVATELGIGRKTEDWAQGIVGYPEQGSVDRQKSPQKPAGHSVLVVGYDDNKVVKIKQQMADGTVQEFTYTGVYYFKNSWGKDSFGVDFALNGQRAPGYGMIVQQYAHEYGAFYKMNLR